MEFTYWHDDTDDGSELELLCEVDAGGGEPETEDCPGDPGWFNIITIKVVRRGEDGTYMGTREPTEDDNIPPRAELETSLQAEALESAGEARAQERWEARQDAAEARAERWRDRF